MTTAWSWSLLFDQNVLLDLTIGCFSFYWQPTKRTYTSHSRVSHPSKITSLTAIYRTWVLSTDFIIHNKIYFICKRLKWDKVKTRVQELTDCEVASDNDEWWFETAASEVWRQRLSQESQPCHRRPYLFSHHVAKGGGEITLRLIFCLALPNHLEVSQMFCWFFCIWFG